MQFSSGEKLILLMLSGIYEKLGIEDGINPNFVRNSIYNESTWAISWKYPGIVGSGKEETPQVVSDVLDILEMWESLEFSYQQLQPAEQARVKSQAQRFSDVRFRGFDGNNETEYMGTAHVLVDDLDRFSSFKGRDFNAHMPVLDTYQHMLSIFLPLRGSNPLTVDQIIQILNV